jgi:hypothetical protein
LSAEQDKVRTLAERIAGRLAEDAARREGKAAPAASPDEAGGELAQLRATLRELQQRLAHVESHVGHGEDCGGAERRTEGAGGSGSGAPRPPSSWQQPQQGGGHDAAGRAPHQFLSSTYVSAAHPSQERFAIDEAVSELVDFFEREKVCSVEPGGKPCDHCAMCSSRGF